VGQEILYCGTCHGQVRGSDFETLKALRIDRGAYCPKCAKAKLATLPPEDQALVLRQNQSEPARPSLETPRPPGTRRAVVSRKAPGTTAVLVAIGLAIAVGIPVFLNWTRRDPLPDPPPRRGVEAPHVVPPVTVAPADPGLQKKEAAARATLEQAREYARLHPEDLEGQLGRFEQAVWNAKETSLDFDARKERAAALAQLHAGIAADLVAVDARLKGVYEREAFRAALGDLDDARRRYAAADWTSAIDQKSREVRELAARLYAPLLEKAVDARRRGAEEELTRAEERLARWGLEDLSADLARALAQVPNVPAIPAVSPEVTAYRSAWENALALAAFRDAAGAAKLLESAAGPDAAADLELLRLLAAFHDEQRQLLQKLPKGQKLSLSWLDDEGRPAQAAGALLKVEAGRAELKKDDQVLALLIGEILPSTWSELYRNRPSRKPGPDERASALFLLVEGDAAIAPTIRSKPELQIPEKYLAWAARRRAASARPETLEAEQRARQAYGTAEQELLLPATRALGALRCRELLEKDKDVRFVAHNRAAIASRVDAGKDYVFLPDDLAASGTFRLTTSKTGSVWTQEGDADPARKKENYVDVRFSTLPEGEYRAWVYVGGCCTEGLTFAVQGTQMRMAASEPPLAAEPGADGSLPVKPAIATGIRNHAAHAGKKPPLKWGWVEVALPKYASAGTKMLRLLGDQPAFSVSAAVVSSTRMAPPGDAELKELVRVRALEPDRSASRTAKLVPLSGLAAWYRADQGVVQAGAMVREWKDQSPYGRHAVQATEARQPSVAAAACNGKPALVFDGNAKNLLSNVPVNGLGGLTCILVSSCEQDDDLMPRCTPLLWGETGNWGITHVAPRRSGIVFMFGTGLQSIVNYVRPEPLPGFTLTTARKDGPLESLYVNGAPVWSGAGRAPKLQGTSPALSVGGDFNGSFFNGKIAEILVYERALSDPERQRVEQYLKLKYRLN